MHAFHYQALPIDVHFASGQMSNIHNILSSYGYQRILIITTAGQQAAGEGLLARLHDMAVGVYPHAVMHVPHAVAQQAIQAVQALQVDCCLALGGGSAIGLAKAIALETHLPIIAIPTTYAGSEMTTVYGITENQLKTTGKAAQVLPKVVIYDPELTLNLPTEISACSGMNAMAHAVEALYAQDKNPIVSLMAGESIRHLAQALPEIVQNPHHLQAREQAMYGAWLAGVCLGSVGMAIHHKICHSLGGRYQLAHAQSHAIILAYSVHYNRHADIDAMNQLAAALNVSDREQLGLAIYQLNQKLNIPMALKDLGLPETAPAEVARMICDSPYYNPREYDYAELVALIDQSLLGTSTNLILLKNSIIEKTEAT